MSNGFFICSDEDKNRAAIHRYDSSVNFCFYIIDSYAPAGLLEAVDSAEGPPVLPAGVI